MISIFIHQLLKYDWRDFSSKQRSFYFTKSSRGPDPTTQWAGSNHATGRIWHAGRMFDTPGLRILHSKIVGEPIEYSRCLSLHASTNFFSPRKILIVLFITKQYQPFCVKTGGDALMKLPCSGLLPSIEVSLCYLRKWRTGELLLLF